MNKNQNLDKLYIKRESLFLAADQRLDKDIDLGFDYRGRLYEKYSSPFLFKIDHVRDFLPFLDKMVTHLIEKTKEIKKTFAYAVPKKSRNIN